MIPTKKIFTVATLCCYIVTNFLAEAYNVDNITIKRVGRPGSAFLKRLREHKEGTHYFGYDFIFDVDPVLNQTRLVVTSSNVSRTAEPNANDLGRDGDITGETFACYIDPFNFFSENFSMCEQVKNSLPAGKPRSMSPGKLLTCSLGKNLNCGDAVYKPGFCYRSNNDGRSWMRFDHPNIDCPIFNVDVMFVLDGSGSIGDKNFLKVINWVLDITRKFDIDGGKVRVGVVQFSHWFASRAPDDQPYMKIEIGLGEHDSFAAFSKAIHNIKLQSYTTYTAHALNVTAQDFIASDRFTESTTKKVMILLTDGASHDFDYLPASANYIRSLGIETYAIGVGSIPITQELRIIATGDVTSPKNVYEVSSFNGLRQIVSELQVKILKNVLEGANAKTKWTFDLELGQVGFSSTSSKKVSEMGVSLEVSKYFCV